MTKKISATELYSLRNSIPILWFITEILKLQTLSTGNILRFQCPCCEKFDTATNQVTNLARCFLCQKNFNTIDLLILIKQISFPSAVQFLQKCLTQVPSKTISSNNKTPRLQTFKKPLPYSRPDAQQLLRVSQILAQYKISTS